MLNGIEPVMNFSDCTNMSPEQLHSSACGSFTRLSHRTLNSLLGAFHLNNSRPIVRPKSLFFVRLAIFFGFPLGRVDTPFASLASRQREKTQLRPRAIILLPRDIILSRKHCSCCQEPGRLPSPIEICGRTRETTHAVSSGQPTGFPSPISPSDG